MRSETLFQMSSSIIPPGKLVFVVDDDESFRMSCMERLDRLLRQLAPQENDLDFLAAGSLKKFEALLVMLREENRVSDLIYALVDLKLPAVERSGELDHEEMIRNGRLVYGQLRQLKVPTLLISGTARREVSDKMLAAEHAHFLPKEEFNRNDDKAKDVAIQILCARYKTPSISLDCCEVIESPVLGRGRRRCLPLAFESSAMSALRTRIYGKATKDAAAVLLLGESGVEFEQLAWLLFREITRANDSGDGPAYRYCPFNCESGSSPVSLLQESREGLKDHQGEQLRKLIFIENVNILGEPELARFCDVLASSPAIRIDGDRIVLTVAREKQLAADRDKKDDVSRLLDLFCLAGFDDFILLEVPGLSRRRREDIAVYAEYYRRQRMEDKHESTLLFDQRALNLIQDLDYERHFKQLSIVLDELFRVTNGDIITPKDVRIVDSSRFMGTVIRGVVEHILTTEPEELTVGAQWAPGDLLEMCSRYLVHRGDRMSPTFDEEDKVFYNELEQIVEALEHASRLGTEEGKSLVKELQRRGPRFWPWNRYPFCPRLLSHLHRHGLTVGLVPYSEIRQ